MIFLCAFGYFSVRNLPNATPINSIACEKFMPSYLEQHTQWQQRHERRLTIDDDVLLLPLEACPWSSYLQQNP